MRSYREYLSENATEQWVDEKGLVYSLVQVSMGHYCGYVTYPARLAQEEAYSGILAYVPVHGGITLAEEAFDGAMTYGFDCMHVGDDTDPNCTNIDWLKMQCEMMAQGIDIAIRYETKYLAASGEERLVVITEYLNEVAEAYTVDLSNNFLVNLNILFGSY